MTAWVALLWAGASLGAAILVLTFAARGIDFTERLVRARNEAKKRRERVAAPKKEQQSIDIG